MIALASFFFAAVIIWITRFHLDLIAIRDAAPYLYSFVGLLSGAACANSSKPARDRSAKILLVALYLHALWTCATLLVPTIPETMPLASPEQDLHLFEVRPDFDTPLLAILAGWTMFRLAKGAGKAWIEVPFLMLLVAAIALTPSRAGLVAAALVLALAVLAVLRSATVHKNRQFSLALAAVVAVAAAVFIIPQLTIGARIAGTFGSVQSTAAIGAGGTAQARASAWRDVWEFTADEPGRLVFGVGFGPNFMVSSGAALDLVGTNEGGETRPRSPHNYWLGTFARGGLLLAGLIAMVTFMFLWRVVRLLNALLYEPLLFLAVTIPLSMLVPATLGVVLEAPFGAVPFFWGLGVVFSWPIAGFAAARRHIA